MDYASLYKQKLTTAEKAAEVVKSGDWVDYGWCVYAGRIRQGSRKTSAGIG